MPTLKCDSATRVLFRELRVKEGRKDKDIVRDMVLAYSKGKEHKGRAKKWKAFVKKRDKEDRAKSKASAERPKRGKGRLGWSSPGKPEPAGEGPEAA